MKDYRIRIKEGHHIVDMKPMPDHPLVEMIENFSTAASNAAEALSKYFEGISKIK